MNHKYISVLIFLLAVLAIDIAVIARENATEAPAGFDTPTLAQNPGSQSISNGIAQPPAILMLSTKPNLRKTTMPALDWGRYSMPGRARIVTKTR